MKKLILLLSVLFIVSCSSENNDDAVIKEGNFLDVYNGVVWKNYIENIKVSYWFVFTPISVSEAEYMDGQGDDCQVYISKWGVQTLDGKVVIKENSKNLLKFDFVDNNGVIDDSYTLTTSQNGNVLNFSMSGGGTQTFDRATTKPCE